MCKWDFAGESRSFRSNIPHINIFIINRLGVYRELRNTRDPKE
jgi:hypothetical protein